MFGLFDSLTNAVENGLGVLGGLVEGELPSKRQLATLISDGISIYAISEATGYSVEVLEKNIRRIVKVS